MHPERIRTDSTALAALYRSVLANKRVLVVLDNARDTDQVRPLLPGAPGCLVIITSRNQLTGLIAAEGARPLTLDLLSEEDAGRLLACRLGPRRVAAEKTAVTEIIRACARLPLALAIVTARATTHPEFPLATFATELRSSHGLDGFEGNDTDVRAVFDWSYRTLTPDAARLFRLLGIHPGSGFTLNAAASLAGTSSAGTRRLLNELTGAHLIGESTPGRYSLHDLLRAYTTELTQRYDAEDDRRAALHRIVDYYLHTAFTADRLLQRRVTIALGAAAPGTTPEPLAGPEEAVTWFSAEEPALFSALRDAVAASMDSHVWRLAWTLEEYLDMRGRLVDLATAQYLGLAAAQRLADPTGQAHLHGGLAHAQTKLERYTERLSQNSF